MPKPVKPIAVCTGCGAVSTEQGHLLDNRHFENCDGARRLVIPAPLDVSITDPVAKVRNEYAARVRDRMAADVAYLMLQADQGHAIAAEQVCEQFGHDARAGMCMRCGVRLGRAYEEELT